MALSGRGGRPRNAWTSSRQRLLVRLWTLTTLNKEEIQKVLKDDSFNPRWELIVLYVARTFSRLIVSTVRVTFRKDYDYSYLQTMQKNINNFALQMRPP